MGLPGKRCRDAKGAEERPRQEEIQEHRQECLCHRRERYGPEDLPLQNQEKPKTQVQEPAFAKTTAGKTTLGYARV